MGAKLPLRRPLDEGVRGHSLHGAILNPAQRLTATILNPRTMQFRLVPTCGEAIGLSLGFPTSVPQPITATQLDLWRQYTG